MTIVNGRDLLKLFFPVLLILLLLPVSVIVSGAQSCGDVHMPGDWIVDSAATVSTKGERHKECTICSAVLEVEEIEKLSPAVIKGQNGKWKRGSGVSLSFTSNAPVGDFTGLFVDGKRVDEKNYILKSGSTVVELKKEYLETLLSGKHLMTISSGTGDAQTNFTIEQKVSSDFSSPDTGSVFSPLIWIGILFVSVLTLTGFELDKRRKSKSEK